jgi:RimJ/RimL family protein N-acetyltransferase
MLHGKQVTLRAIEPDDLPFLQRLANDPTVRGYLVGTNPPLSVAGQRGWFDQISRDPTTQRLMVQDAHDGEVLGMSGLWDIDFVHGSAESAIKLDPSALEGRRGTGTDTLKTVCAYAFFHLGLRRLSASILEFNQASLHLYAGKLGFRIEGRSRSAFQRKGRWFDIYQLGLLRHEFEALTDARDYVELVCPVPGEGPVPEVPPHWWAAPPEPSEG